MNIAERLPHADLLRHIGEVAQALNREVYAVGGFVRDIFLDRSSPDIDFVTVGSGIELAKAVAASLGHTTPPAVFATYGTAQLKHHGLELEFVGARKESYNRNSRNPMVEEGSLDDDMSRRDFTVNAMAVSLNPATFGEVIDPFGGMDDLKRGILRTPLDPDITFSDDPLRMMRAIRFATQLQFRVLPETFEAIKRNADRLHIITKERINDELGKIMRSRKPSTGWRLLDMAGLLDIIIPELVLLKGVETKEGRGHKDNFAHTLKVLDNVSERSDNEWLRWSALMHDIAKPVTKRYDPVLGWTFHNHNFIGEKMVKRIFRQMKMPQNDKMKYVAKMVGLHMRPQSVAEEGVSDSAVRRLITDSGEDLNDLMILCESDITSKNPEKVQRQLKGFERLRERMDRVADADALRNWKNPLNGIELMQLFGWEPGVETGKKIQEIKDAVKEAILEGKIPYDHDSALEYAKKSVACS